MEIKQKSFFFGGGNGRKCPSLVVTSLLPLEQELGSVKRGNLLPSGIRAHFPAPPFPLGARLFFKELPFPVLSLKNENKAGAAEVSQLFTASEKPIKNPS